MAGGSGHSLQTLCMSTYRTPSQVRVCTCKRPANSQTHGSQLPGDTIKGLMPASSDILRYKCILFEANCLDGVVWPQAGPAAVTGITKASVQCARRFSAPGPPAVMIARPKSAGASTLRGEGRCGVVVTRNSKLHTRSPGPTSRREVSVQTGIR